MIRPTRHPTSGVYRLRLGIPARLRDAAKMLHGVRAELIESLGTLDAKEAKPSVPTMMSLHAEFAASKKRHQETGQFDLYQILLYN